MDECIFQNIIDRLERAARLTHGEMQKAVRFCIETIKDELTLQLITSDQPDYSSEEGCAHCDNVVAINTVRWFCPDCKKLNVSCNSCDNKNCGICVAGSAFQRGW